MGEKNIVPHVEAALERAREMGGQFSGLGDEIARDLVRANLGRGRDEVSVTPWPRVRVRGSPRRLRAPGLPSKFFEHAARIDEVIVENAARHDEELFDGRVTQGVAHRQPLLLGRHDALVAQHGQLLRHHRLLQVERLLEFLHGPDRP